MAASQSKAKTTLLLYPTDRQQKQPLNSVASEANNCEEVAELARFLGKSGNIYRSWGMFLTQGDGLV